YDQRRQGKEVWLHSINDHNPSLPHKIAFFALLIVTDGTGKHQIDFKDYDVEKGTVLKIAKGQVHAFQDNPTYEGYLLIFTEEFILNYFPPSSISLISQLYNYHITSPLFFDKDINEEIVRQISTELNAKDSYAHNNIIAAILNLYLLKLERSTRTFGREINNSKNYDTFIQFKNLVESNYTTTRNVKDYAAMMSISSKQLNQILQEFTINAAKEFIDDYVILETKRLLVSTNNSIKEIAFEVGFDEVTNFTKFFKNKLAMTPKEFKRFKLQFLD
ncbi:MAG: AraC family transcriptional regulator, partial [Spirosomaceae bacterium]|nr:AraC family transcriptional regulator [Spirosomataceae bacterium]